MRLYSEFSCNSVIWLSSVPVNEQGPTRRMTEDMETIAQQIGFGFQRIDINSTDQLIKLLEELTFNAHKHNMRPMLHIDMHGCEENGLLISSANKYVSWEVLAEHFRKLNVATGNNLCVVGAACFSLRAVMPIRLNQPTPFFILLAPEKEVNIGFLERNVTAFYRSLLESGSIDYAYSMHLSDEFKYVHCEKILFIVVARYILRGCKGKLGEERRERLLSEVFLQGMEKSNKNLKLVRNKIKQGLRPDQTLLDRYAGTFLINRACSFNINQLLAFLEGYSA